MKKICKVVGKVLVVLAVAFVNVPCGGKIYEPKIPEKLRKHEDKVPF